MPFSATMTQGNLRVAVLTGDLVRSRSYPSGATTAAIEVIARAASVLAHRTDQPLHVERHRGDGWQILLLRPELALRQALLITANLRMRRLPLTRFAIGIGSVPRLRAANLAAESGQAFELSGDILANMPRRSHFGMTSAAPKISDLTMAALQLADHITRDWTAEQAEAMSLALDPIALSGQDIAKALDISAAAASYRLQGAKWPDIRAVVAAFEQEWGEPDV